MTPRSPVRVPEKLSRNRRTVVTGQAIWNGTISFSLVAIPVQLVMAVDSGRVTFRMLHGKDYAPLQRRMFCPEENKIISQEEIVRGYEIEPDKYILVTDEELASVSPERSSTIEIIEFIEMQEVDPLYYDHPYYLVPAKGGEKAYCLLAEVMKKTARAGLAKFVLGEREYLVSIYSSSGALALITLHYSSEILSDDDLSPKEEDIEPGEKLLVEKTIMEMLKAFDPRKYADRRQRKILDLLRKKAKERPLVAAPRFDEEVEEGPADLLAALKESMLKVKQGR